jgi:hypothetical protein
MRHPLALIIILDKRGFLKKRNHGKNVGMIDTHRRTSHHSFDHKHALILNERFSKGTLKIGSKSIF